MTASTNSRRKRSDATRSLIRHSALERGAQRSADVRTRVEAVIKAIEVEIAENGGIYPSNEGAVSAAEVARRAGVHPTTLYSKTQRGLGEAVQKWLKQLKKEKPIGRGPAKKSLTTRIADWKLLYEKLQQSHRDTELSLQQTQAELEEVRKAAEELKEQHAKLLSLIGKSGVAKIALLRPNKN